tara:strand:- start:624 stop:1823 length:1200 start_codon:yes stop_codon:yes gene_type:complete
MNSKLILLIFISFVFCQDINQISFKVNNSSQNSWWSKSNNNGLNPDDSYLSIEINKQFYNFDLTLTSYLNDKKFILGESFINFSIKENYNLKIGRYYRDFSTYLNDDISSGSMLISKNALPMPKIGFIGKFFPKRNEKLRFSYGISHAFFDKNILYRNPPYLHEKYVYLIRKNKIEFGIGFVHEAIWAGSTYNDEQFPKKFKDFLKILISADDELKPGQAHANAMGNHLGIWDFYIKKENTRDVLKIYYQHFFEDTSGLRFANRTDGLWGLEFIDKANKVNYLIEYLNTSNQDRDPPYVKDSYYNHFEYTLGWSYKGLVIGNPFINNLNPNPLKLIHLGFQTFENNNLQLKLLLSKRVDIKDSIKYSINAGKKFNQFSILLYLNGDKDKDLGVKLYYDL